MASAESVTDSDQSPAARPLTLKLAQWVGLLLLLGLPFFLTREPVSVLEQAAKCLLNCSLAFVVNFVAQNVAADTMYSALPAWIPIMVFAPLAVVYLDSVKM